MFFVTLRLLLPLVFIGLCAYAYISWAKRTTLKSEVEEAIKEIDEMLELNKDVPNHKFEKIRLAKKRLNRLINKGE